MPKTLPDSPQPDTILRLPAVMARTGLSSVTIWRQERSGDFPQRLQLGDHAVGWREADIAGWIAGRPRRW